METQKQENSEKACHIWHLKRNTKQAYDKNTLRLPRQDKRVDCIPPQRGAVSGQITAYKKARYYDIATNEGLEPKI